MNEIHKYDRIIDLPHQQSKTRPHMSMEARAAQFSPFAPLTGHGEAIRETERLTDQWCEPSEDEKAVLSAKTVRLIERIEERPEISVTCFVPDEWKSGGSYVNAAGRLRRVDPVRGCFFMTDGRQIPLAYVTEIEIMDEAESDPL